MTYRAIVTDDYPECPGEAISPPFATLKEAQWWADRELKAGRELFPSSIFTSRIVKT